jgi:RNA polymerase subunit RPABC4/transcription elongation factor Spt4
MPLINCTECGKQVSTHAKACPNCGHPVAEMQASLPVANIKCPYCRKDVASNLEICPYCHMRIGSLNASGVSSLLIICGILCSIYFWFFYETSVSTGFGDVNNIGLMQNRQLGLIVGIGVVIIGVIMFAISKKSD